MVILDSTYDPEVEEVKVRPTEEMTPEEVTATAGFLFGDPPGHLDEFAALEARESPLRATLLAFKANLTSAVLVGSIPFMLAHGSTIEDRFHSLSTGERIRGLKLVSAGEELTSEIIKAADDSARTKLNAELTDPETIKILARCTLNFLAGHLKDSEFRASAQELMRQVLVICWGAFEVLANDTLRVLINERPKIIRAFVEVKPYRDFLSNRALLDALEANRFDLSSTMGDLFCEAVRLDSLEKIREVFGLALAAPHVDIALRNDRLWKISQQRHLIVHRRGLVDARYLERTSDRLSIGNPILLDADYIDASITAVRNIGCELYQASLARLENG
jgi:hypothetical protein